MNKKEVKLIVDSVSERVEKNVKDHLTGIFDVKFKNLQKQIDALQTTWDVHAEEWSTDRKELSNMKVEMAGINQWFKEFSESVGKMTKTIVTKVGDKMEAAQEKMVDAVSETVPESVKEVVQPKKKVLELKEKRSFLDFFKRR